MNDHANNQRPRTPGLRDWQDTAARSAARSQARRRARRMLTASTLGAGLLWAAIIAATLELLRVIA